MQYSALRTVAQLHPGWNLAWRWLRVMLWLSVLGYCVYRWQMGYTVELASALSSTLASPATVGVLLLVVALMPLNWYLETLRWQRLAAAQEPLSWRKAWQGVWMGLALGLWMPRLLAEYVGRVGELPRTERKENVGRVFLAQATMMNATLTVGLAGALSFWQVPGAWGFALLTMAFWPWAVWRVLQSGHGWVRRLYPGYHPDALSHTAYWQIQGLAYLRYLIFFVQYGLLLYLFLPPLTTSALWGGVAWVFLVKSATPFLHVLGDLGVREFSALLYFEALGVPAAAIITPTALLWSLNVLIPTALGALVWLKKNRR